MGQWSGCNRERDEANQRSHRRLHITDSAEQVAGGGEEGVGDTGNVEIHCKPG